MEIEEHGGNTTYYNIEAYVDREMNDALSEIDGRVMMKHLIKISEDGVALRKMFFSERELSDSYFYDDPSTVADYIWFMEEQADRNYSLAERLKEEARDLIKEGEDIFYQDNLLERMIAAKTASRNCIHETLYVEKTAREMGVFDSGVIRARDFEM